MPFPDAWQGGVLRKLPVEGSVQEFQQGKSRMYKRRNETNSGDRKMWRGKQGNAHSPLSKLGALLHFFSGFHNTKPHLLTAGSSGDHKIYLLYLICCETKIEFSSLACPASHGSLWDPRGARQSLVGLWLESAAAPRWCAGVRQKLKCKL